MTLLHIVLALLGLSLSFIALRALSREAPTYCLTWQRESGFGVVGGAVLFYVGVKEYGNWIPLDVLLVLLGVIIVLVGLLSGFSATRLAFYIDNGRWPTNQERSEDFWRSTKR